jgi:hypothetical protein
MTPRGPGLLDALGFPGPHPAISANKGNRMGLRTRLFERFDDLQTNRQDRLRLIKQHLIKEMLEAGAITPARAREVESFDLPDLIALLIEVAPQLVKLFELLISIL